MATKALQKYNPSDKGIPVMCYDFDQIIDRSGNHAAKYDERAKKFGTDRKSVV